MSVSIEGSYKNDRKTHVKSVVPVECQPLGDAMVSCGSVRTSNPWVRFCFVIGRTRYYMNNSQEHRPSEKAIVLTEALETKSLTCRSSPEWASTNASSQAPAFSFRIWTTCVRAAEPSDLTKYWMEAG